MKSIKISVRNLVEFLLRQGNIDNRIHHAPDTAMAEGGRIHRMIQKKQGPDYHPEVPLSHTITKEEYTLTIDGRADGILERKDKPVLIDEIKGTYRDIKKLKDPDEVHLAQAKCYAAIYLIQNELSEITVQITYCNIDTEEIKYFATDYDKESITTWFNELLDSYHKWALFLAQWEVIRQESIHKVNFPFPYREGQKELAAGVYRTIYHKRKLFMEAPTGTGKTITTIFPAIKALGENKGDRIFYLTAKTITRTVAENAFATLREHENLKFKTVTLTAKDKICVLSKSDCNPAACSRANGHFDRINDCIYELLTTKDNFDRDAVMEMADKYQVCPFELSLDMSLWADAVICDYNYAFDPFVYLKRFFSDGAKGENIFLIDEAHNLLDRGRDMYSSELYFDELYNVRNLIEDYHPKIAGLIKKCETEMEKIFAGVDGCEVLFDIGPLMQALLRVSSVISAYLEDHAEGIYRDELLDFYFDLSEFSTIYEYVDDKYVIYAEEDEEERRKIKLFCVDPSENLSLCMARARSSILFSATLLPIQYHKALLGGTDEDYEIYAHSVFDSSKCGRLLATDVTSKYTRRGEYEYRKIARYIHDIVSAKAGNYLIFFPSRIFMDDVGIIYEKEFFDETKEEILVQNESMSEEEREEFLSRFTAGNDIDFSGIINMDVDIEPSKSILGFCVMGGIFSEGIDLKEDSLIGVIIVGTGFPQVCNEREIIKDYFEKNGEDGFDYAYRYPGMNKVLQAAGRVIRTEADMGVVALLDERFTQRAYTELFPREWTNIRLVSTGTVKRTVNALWSELLDK